MESICKSKIAIFLFGVKSGDPRYKIKKRGEV